MKLILLILSAYIFCAYSLLMPLLRGALLPPSVIYHLNMTHSLGVQSMALSFLFHIKIPTCRFNVFILSQQRPAYWKIYYNTMIHSFINRMPHCIIPTMLLFLWQCHTRTVTSGPLMSTRVLSLPTVMTTGRPSFTRFLWWPRSSYKVNTGQTNERMSCLELHSETLVCGLLPLTNLIP